jgi:surface polysaccharide O-acyltransferase-like enzyme
MLYLLMFLMGYYIFSQDNVIETLKKFAPAFLGVGMLLGVIQTYLCWGKFYQSVVNDWYVMLYTWIMVLAVFGCFARYFNRQSKFSARMSGLSFGIYLFHYLPLIYIAYFLSVKCNLPLALNYILTFAGTLVSAVLLTVIVKKIPVLNFLFGLKRAEKK